MNVSKVKLAIILEGDHSQGRPENSLFSSYYTLPLIRTLYCWVLSKEVSSTIFKVFGITWPGIEPRSPGPLANTLPTRPMSWFKGKLATIVEGYLKVPFSIATTPRCRGGARFLSQDPYLIMLSVKQGGIKYHFWVFGMIWPGIEPRSPGPLANTLTIMPMSGIIECTRPKNSKEETTKIRTLLIVNSVWK